MKWYDFFIQHGFVFELIISTAMLTWWMERREQFAWRIMGCIAALLGVSLLWSRLPVQNAWSKSLRYMVIFAVCAGAVMFCFRVKSSRAVFQVTAAGAVQHFSFKAARTGQFLLFMLKPPGFMGEVFTYPALLLVFWVVSYLVFAQWLNREEIEELESRSVLRLLIGMLLFVNLFQNLFDENSADIGARLYTIFELFDLVCGIFMLSLQCEIANRKVAEQNNAILKHILHQQKEQMESSKETIDLINIKCHDLKNQIAMLGSRIPKEEIEELNHTISIYDTTAKTGNEALDVLLAEKLLLCENKSIHFDYMADGESLSVLKPSDIYSLFGNAIDNAIEAADKVEDPSRRHIGMKVRTDKGMLMIHFENCYNGILSFDSDLPKTTKQDKRYHGFGMKSIKLITEQYGGYMKVNAGEDLFTLNILIPLKKRQ